MLISSTSTTYFTSALEGGGVFRGDGFVVQVILADGNEFIFQEQRLTVLVGFQGFTAEQGVTGIEEAVGVGEVTRVQPSAKVHVSAGAEVKWNLLYVQTHIILEEESIQIY